MSATSSSRLVEAAIEPMAKLMKEAGYRKNGRNFSKTSGTSVAILNVQSSRWNSEDSARFTINLGSYIPAISSVTNGGHDAAPRSYEDCSWFIGIGFIMPSRNDKWWAVSPEFPTDDISEEVLFDVKTFALPWLERNFSVEGLIESLRISGNRGAADLLWKLGQRHAAVECIHLVPPNTAARKAAIQQWLKEHTLEP